MSNLNKKSLVENGFEGGVSGASGVCNYAPTHGTFSSPDASQNDSQFSNSNNNKAVNQNSNTRKEGPELTGSISNDINALYAKKDTPTPDDIVCGIKYELGKQLKKDKAEAKKEVLKNLRKDPHFYNELKMLNITDQDMVNNMTENKHPNDSPARTKIVSNIDETKKIFAEMSKNKDNKYVVNSQICDVMKELWAAKKARKL